MPAVLDIFDENKQVVVFLMYAIADEIRELVKLATTDQLRDINTRIERLTDDEFRNKETIIGSAVVDRADGLSAALLAEIRRRGNRS